jgi:hypothetical protein
MDQSELTLDHRSRIFYTLKTEAIRSAETAVNTISTRRHIQEDGIFHSHRRENLKSYLQIKFKYHSPSSFPQFR